MPTEVCLHSHIAPLRVTVGYDRDRDGYYVLVHDINLHQWNERVWDLMDTLNFEDPFDHVRIDCLDASIVEALKDNSMESLGPLSLDQVIQILALVARVSEDQMTTIIHMKETRH